MNSHLEQVAQLQARSLKLGAEIEAGVPDHESLVALRDRDETLFEQVMSVIVHNNSLDVRSQDLCRWLMGSEEELKTSITRLDAALEYMRQNDFDDDEMRDHLQDERATDVAALTRSVEGTDALSHEWLSQLRDVVAERERRMVECDELRVAVAAVLDEQ